MWCWVRCLYVHTRKRAHDIYTCHTRYACQCDTWRQMCTWSHRITNNAPIQTSLFAHMTNLTFVLHILHITMPWNNSRRLKMNSLTVKIIRPADVSCKEMLYCTCMSTARTSAYMCVYCVSSMYNYILIMQCEERCKCTMCMHIIQSCLHAFHQMFWLCCGILMPSLSCPCGLAVMYCCSWWWKLVVCAIVHNRNAVVCPCLCTVEASHFCVWMCLSYFSSIMRCSTKKGPHFHQHYFHHRRHRTSSTVDLHVSFVQFAALHSFCIS